MYRDTFLLLGFLRFLGSLANRQFQVIRNYRLPRPSVKIIFYRVDMELVNLDHGQQHSLTLCWVCQAIMQVRAVRWTGDHQSVGILLDGARLELGLMYELSRQAIRQGGKAIATNMGVRNVSITLPIAVSNILAAVCSSYTNAIGNTVNSGQVCDFTGKSLTITIDNGVGIWLAICKQTGWKLQDQHHNWLPSCIPKILRSRHFRTDLWRWQE